MSSEIYNMLFEPIADREPGELFWCLQEIGVDATPVDGDRLEIPGYGRIYLDENDQWVCEQIHGPPATARLADQELLGDLLDVARDAATT